MQNAGLRDIAHIADTFSTEGLDTQQIESISRIRNIVHECLRDQIGIGGTVIITDIPEEEPGNNIRGKERVRRRGSGKRSRKGDAVQYYTVSEDEQSQFLSATIEVEQLHVSHLDGEVDDEVDHVQLIHANPDGDNMHLCDANIEVDESELAYEIGEEGNVELNHEATKVNYEGWHGVGQEIKEEPNHIEENMEEMGPVDNGISSQQCSNGVGNSQLPHSDRETVVSVSSSPSAEAAAADGGDSTFFS